MALSSQAAATCSLRRNEIDRLSASAFLRGDPAGGLHRLELATLLRIPTLLGSQREEAFDSSQPLT